MLKKAVTTGAGEPLKVIEGCLPEVPEEGALIRTHYGGLCHSDINMIKGDKFSGVTLCHEICGVVERLGTKAEIKTSKSLSVGDQVMVYPWIGCMECSNCKIGLNNHCIAEGGAHMHIGEREYMGGFSTHMVVPNTEFLIKVPTNIPAPMAAMLPCSATTAYASLKRAKNHMETGIKARGQGTLLIIGAGGLGLWCTKLAKTSLLPKKIKVKVADISGDKTQAALSYGAEEVILWNKGMSDDAMFDTATKGGKDRVDVVINFVGTSSTCNVAVKCLYEGGLQIVNGLFGGSVNVSSRYLAMHSITIMGNLTSTLEEFKELVELVSKEKIDYPNLQFYSLDDVNKAIDDLDSGKVVGRAIIKHDY